MNMTDEVPQLLDGKAAKLRASCDACNESKVRCSQTKPSCTRCQKQGVVCVYGLSRRSHKSAPRVGASRPSPTIDISLSQDDSAAATDAETSTGNPSARHSISSVLSPSFQDTEGTAAAASNQAQTCSDQPSINFIDNFSSTDFNLPSLICNEGIESLGNCAMSPFALFDQFNTFVPHDLLNNSESPSQPPRLASELSDGCHCISRATSELTSTLLLSDTSGSSVDVQLSIIKRAIQISQDCINCTCFTGELAIVTFLLLVGRIIKGFEIILGADLPLAPAASLNTRNDSVGSATPKLTWGKLPIEVEEEHQLKKHLFWLNFQKLERLLGQLSDSIKQLRIRQGSNNSAHVMACECMHMWLEQWANVVKNGFT